LSRQLVLGQGRKGAVEQPEQHHRRPADEIDMGMQMRLIEALVDADPDAEGKAEGAIQQPDQNEPAVDVFYGLPFLRLGFTSD
jgi:hypothetical protein